MPVERAVKRWFLPGSKLGLESIPAIDFQMHTTWTDGQSSVREMIDSARAAGLAAMAITEHVNEASAWYPQFVADVQAARADAGGMQVFYGAEIAAADFHGGLKAEPERIETEIVLGVVHRYPKEGGGFWTFDEVKKEDAVALELRALEGLAKGGRIDVLGHPGGTTFKKFGPFPYEWMEPAFIAARDHGVAVELNTKYLWDPAGALAVLRRVNPLVSFGSDAHRAADVGMNVPILRRDFDPAPVLSEK